MMMICGLQVIVQSKVPSARRYGRNCVVVEPKEASALACAANGIGDQKPLIDLLEGHQAYLQAQAEAAA